MAQGESMLKTVYAIESGDFVSAGEASSHMKNDLKRLGINNELIRKVSIAAYECEMNMIIHSLGGQMTLQVDDEGINLIAEDTGPGIEDTDQAMREGFSTASDDVRMMGFGAGMGLPNMKRNADEFDISSRFGVGTTIRMRFALGNPR